VFPVRYGMNAYIYIYIYTYIMYFRVHATSDSTEDIIFSNRERERERGDCSSHVSVTAPGHT
jgi:hypothetical protein